MVKRFWVLFLVCLLLAGLAACGTSESGYTGGDTYQDPQPQSPAPIPEGDGSSAVPWRDAGDHEGEFVTVEGPVAGTLYAETSNGEPTFLNVGRDYPNPDRFTVVIWGEDRGAFPKPPEAMYEDVTIRVTGIVDSYEGVPQIEVSSPSDIEIVDEVSSPSEIEIIGDDDRGATSGWVALVITLLVVLLIWSAIR